MPTESPSLTTNPQMALPRVCDFSSSLTDRKFLHSIIFTALTRCTHRVSDVSQQWNDAQLGENLQVHLVFCYFGDDGTNARQQLVVCRLEQVENQPQFADEGSHCFTSVLR